MDAIEQLKEYLRCGRIDPDRVVNLLGSLQQQLQAAQLRIAELEKQLANNSEPAKVEWLAPKLCTRRCESRINRYRRFLGPA